MDCHNISLHWVPGHMGILGNDTANSLAWVMVSPDADTLDPNFPEAQ